MNPSMITAGVSMGELQKKINTIGNNLANVDNNGYKSREARFSSLLTQQMDNIADGEDDQGRLTPDGIRIGYGSGIGQVHTDFKRGDLKQTDRMLDVALTDSNLFFQVATNRNDAPMQDRFTRDGTFYLQPDAADQDVMNLVTSHGDFVRGANGPIQIPADFDDITINKQGEIQVSFANGQTAGAGQLALADINRPQAMEAVGDNQWALPDLDALNLDEADIFQNVDNPTGSVKQGYLEAANVDLSQQMTQLTQAQRSYQLNARALSISDQSMGVINGLRR